MAFIIKIVKGCREHWKKSIFGALAVSYGGSVAKEKYEIQQLMRKYCKEAVIYGESTIEPFNSPRSITVILNPNANKRKAKAQFEKFCEPLLHLAGLNINIIQTESEGHAIKLLDVIYSTDAILIAGGDGTTSEVITGLLRRCGDDPTKNNYNIGVLPLGQSNTLANTLFFEDKPLKEIYALADATMAAIKQNTTPIDVMKIEVMDAEENETKESRPIYAVGKIEWGIFRDAEASKDKYWYFGPLRKYVTYIFNGFKADLNCCCKATIVYSEPCSGCKNCTHHVHRKSRWWQRALKLNMDTPQLVDNPQCKHCIEKEISTTNLVLQSNSEIKSDNKENIPHLSVEMGPEKLNIFEFISKGWDKNKPIMEDNVKARQIQIKPIAPTIKDKWLSIDKEDFELKPITVTLLPKAVNIFCLPNGKE